MNKVNCKATRKFIYVFGDDDWKFEYTLSFACHSEKNTSKEISNAYGTGYRYTETCTVCGETLDDRTRLFDDYGRETYYENHLTKDGYYKVFTGCEYTTYYLNGGESSGTEHTEKWYSAKYEGCTQYRKDGWKCQCCGKEDIEYVEPDRYGWNDGHNWYYDDYSEEYVCGNCGTHSHYGVDGIISLEDMRTEDDATIKIGYFNFREWNIDYNAITEKCPIDIDIVVNYDPDPDAERITLGEGLFTKTVTSPADGYSEKYGYYVHYRESGIVTVDTAKLKAALETCGVTEFKSISVVFSVPERFLFEDKKDSDTYQECALTFSIEELVSLFAE